MMTPGIRLPNGRLIPWDAFRRTMLASPGGALDEAPRGGVATRADQAANFGTRDQRAGLLPPLRGGNDQPNGNGRLTGKYVRATNKYLVEAGIEPQDIDAIDEILGKYLDAAAETEERRPGAADRLAFDAYGNRVRRWRPLTEQQRRDFERRFPGVAAIRVI